LADIFVSYKAEDRRRVAPLVEALKAHGLSVWWDAEIGGGDGWRDTIQQQLENAKCVIVVWSKRSVGPEGHFVRDEASRAQRRRVYLPVRIDKVDPPLGFGETQALSLSGWKGDPADERCAAVVAAARAIISGGERRHSAGGGSGSRVSRRAVVAGGVAAAAVAAGAGAWMLTRPRAGAGDSIAVLPFANLSGDPAQAYFSDGIAEELRGVLARISRLKVIGRTSSELVRDMDATAAASKLGVTNIVTGSVRRSPSLIRVFAELISGRDGAQIWSQTYDRGPGDILMIQSDIAKNVASALSLQLGQREGGSSGATASAAAYDLYLKGVAVREAGHNQENLEQAIGFFDSAIALDPKFADAYAQRAQTAVDLTGVYSSSAEQFDRGYDEAVATARRAISLGPRRALGFAALAAALAGKLDAKGAAAAYRAAFERFAGEVGVLTSASLFLSRTGDTARGLEAANKAVAIDPLNPRPYAMRGMALFIGRRYEEATAAFREGIQVARAPVALGFTSLGLSLMMSGRPDEARRAFAWAPADNVYRLAGEAILDVRSGDRGAAARKFEQLRRRFGDSAAYQQAEVLAQMGQRELAIAALERSLAVRDPGLLNMEHDVFLDPVRGDPRFVALREKLGLEPRAGG
jgi:serine/threonine-protein kinase